MNSVTPPLPTRKLTKLAPIVAQRCCALVVEQYRALQIEKGQAIGQILSLLQAEEAIRPYLGMLDEHDNKRSASKTISTKSQDVTPFFSQMSLENTVSGLPVRQDVEVQAADMPSEQSTAGSVTTDDTAVASHSTLPETSADRVKNIQNVQLQGELSSCPVGTHVVMSLRHKDDYPMDLRALKRALATREDLPKFSDDLLRSILLNDYVDLNLVCNNVSGPKDVTSMEDWIAAWDPYSKIVVLANPPRRREIQNYGKFILRQFAKSPLAGHGRILEFDKRCRTRAAKREDLLLIDYLHCSP